MHGFSVQRRHARRSEIRAAACGKRNSGASASGLEGSGPTGDGLHVSATIVEFGAASEKHDAELFEERLEVSGLLDVNVEVAGDFRMIGAKFASVGHDGVHLTDDGGECADHFDAEAAFAFESEPRISDERTKRFVDAADFGLERFDHRGVTLLRMTDCQGRARNRRVDVVILNPARTSAEQ